MNEENQKKNKPGITHVLLPIEVAFNPKLKYSEKIVWWVINTLDTTDRHCFASNDYIAKKAHLKERASINAITKLIELGYVKRGGFDGRIRVLIIEKDMEKFRSILTKYNEL